MPNPHGTHIWYELLTTDTAAAADFYGKIVGWTAAPFGGGGGGEHDYTVLSHGADGVAGLMKNPMPTGPIWLGYVGVDDVDAAVTKLQSLGGTVHRPAWDTEGVGRMAFVADPQGVTFYVMKGASEMDSHAFSPTAEGHCAWNELITTDQGAALTFYSAMFGWQKAGAMPMGEMGEYTFINHGDQPIGAMMNRTPDSPTSLWNYYFRVSGIDAAAERITANGGKITFGPMEVPGGDWVVNGIDPQGGAFGLVGSK